MKINTLGWVDSPFISRDGLRLYFMYSRYNFFPIFSGGQPFLQGPARVGHHNNDGNPFEDSDLYVSTRSGGAWGTPVNLSLNNYQSQSCAMEVMQGNVRTLYYNSSVGVGGSQNILRAVMGSSGTWLPPALVFPQNGYNETNPHVDPTESGMWFTSDRGGQKDVWFSQQLNGVWQPPVNVGPPINTGAAEDQFYLDPVRNITYFNRDQIYQTVWGANGFSTPVPVNVGVSPAAEVSITDAGNELFFAGLSIAEQRMRIYVSLKRADGSWSAGVPVD